MKSVLLGGVLAVASLFATAEAHATLACVPPPGGVVGMPGPPDWTTGGSAVIDDPRWHGATRETFPNTLAGGSPDSASRLVQSGGLLFLQLQTLADPAPGNTTVVGPNTFYRDSVYVGFATADLATINIVRIAINTSAAPPISAFSWTKSGGTWTSSFGLPMWLSAETGWVSTAVSGITVPWAVNIKIDTSKIPGTKIWYATEISPGGFGGIVAYQWPPGTSGFIEPDPPDTGAAAATWGAQFDAIGATNWGDYTPIAGTLPLPAGCGGVRIESDDIGTTNTPFYKINNNASNTFKAQLSGTATAVSTVKARFRLANWGMQIGVGGDWTDIPGGSYADNRLNDASGLISFTCAYTGGASCPPLPPGPLCASGSCDECMLVELEGASGPVSFSKDSAWHNMIFAPASKYEHDAEISLVGLPADPTPRDVYIYIQAHNMPTVVITPPPGQPTGDIKGDQQTTVNQRYDLEGLNSTERRIALGGPTYEIRGYRDTGKGKPGWQLLEPMVPFGYMMQHSGALYGWAHEFLGIGATVTTIIPDVLYKLSIRPGSKAYVKTRIEALEGPPPAPGPVEHNVHCSCDLAHRGSSPVYLALAALAALAVASRRRVLSRR